MINTLTASRLFPWIIGLAVIIPAVSPLFHPRLFRAHDFTHVARLAELDRTISDGFFPPRWSENLGFGYGMPLFSFYAPLPYYFGQLIHMAGFDYEASVKLLFFVVTYLSFMAMYALSRNFFGRNESILAASLFAYGPYRAVDMYVRGSLGELFGILFIVVSLLAMTKLVSTNKRAWIVLGSLATAGLMLSHNLMALIGLPVVFFWGLGSIIFQKQRDWRLVFSLIISLILGVGLSSYYVIPTLLEKSYTSVDQLTTGGGDYTQHFVYLRQLINSPFGYGGSIEGIHDGISFEIGKIHLGLIIAGAALGLLMRKKVKQFRYVLTFSYGITLLSVFLMSARSSFVWSQLPLIHYLQFPWRFLSLTLIFTSFLGGVAASILLLKSKIIGSVLIWSIMAVVIVYYAPLFQPEYYPDDTSTIYSSDERYIREEMSKVIPDYIHPQMSELVMSQEKNIVIAKERFSITGDSKPSLQVISDTSQDFLLEAQGSGTATITAQIFDFPGWKWWIDGNQTDYQVGSTLPTMSVTLNLERGREVEVRGRLTETRVRLISNWISLISLVLIGLVGKYRTHKT
jgi:hypothetical protein